MSVANDVCPDVETQLNSANVAWSRGSTSYGVIGLKYCIHGFESRTENDLCQLCRVRVTSADEGFSQGSRTLQNP
jgi:hypothetical protein